MQEEKCLVYGLIMNNLKTLTVVAMSGVFSSFPSESVAKCET